MKNKKTQTILIVLSLFLLFGCSKNKANWINTNIDGNILPEKPSLKDDFYQSVNYDDLKNIPLNNGAATAGGQNEMNKILVKHVTSMADSVNKSDSSQDIEKQNLINLFNMSLDWQKRNKDGVQPVMKILKKIQSIKTLDDLTASFADSDVRLFFPLKLDLRGNTGLYYTPYIFINFLFERLRVNAIVQQFNEFYKAYDIKSKDGMYLSPKKRFGM